MPKLTKKQIQFIESLSSRRNDQIVCFRCGSNPGTLKKVTGELIIGSNGQPLGPLSLAKEQLYECLASCSMQEGIEMMRPIRQAERERLQEIRQGNHREAQGKPRERQLGTWGKKEARRMQKGKRYADQLEKLGIKTLEQSGLTLQAPEQPEEAEFIPAE